VTLKLVIVPSQLSCVIYEAGSMVSQHKHKLGCARRGKCPSDIFCT